MATPPTPRSADYEGYEVSGGVGNHEAASSHSWRGAESDDEIAEGIRRAASLDMAFPGLAPRSYGPSYPSFVAHAQTRLADGRHSVIVDPGSVGNLCGDKWAKDIATAAVRAGEKPEHKKRPRPLDVSGVGNGSQACHYDCVLPVRMNSEGQSVRGTFSTPAVANSDLPGLLGLTALRENRAILDFTTLKLHFCGPGDVRMSEALPPGTDSFQLEIAPSGHIVLPCCEFDDRAEAKHSLTLLSRQRQGVGGVGNHEANVQTGGIPHPPVHEPRFPVEFRQSHEPRWPVPEGPPASRL